LFGLLGTPEEDKSHRVIDGGHSFRVVGPLEVGTLAWFDKYLGPVRRETK